MSGDTFLQRVVNRWNSLDQETVDVGSINSFEGRLDKIRKTRMGFLWILYGLQSPKPHGDQTPVRPHKVSYKVSKSEALCQRTYRVYDDMNGKQLGKFLFADDGHMQKHVQVLT